MPDWTTVRASYAGSWSKVWVVGDGAAFDEAAPGLEIERWQEKGTGRGLKVPNPAVLQLDVKGTFVDTSTWREVVDPLKTSRSVDLHERGFS